MPITEYIFPLLLILGGMIVFAVCAAKIIGESKRRANEWLEQQMREDPYHQSRKSPLPER
ncbi:MAG: hypothetical protein V4568_15180 [Pseudomonadota bacterium]